MASSALRSSSLKVSGTGLGPRALAASQIGTTAASPAPTQNARTLPTQTTLMSVCKGLGGVDGFDEDEAESKGNDGAVVLGRLLAAQCNSLEALELADELFDAGAGAIERLREERRPVLGR